MKTNIRSLSDLNTKSEEFMKLHTEIIDYCNKNEFPHLELGISEIFKNVLMILTEANRIIMRL